MSLPHYDIDGWQFISADHQARPNEWLALDARGGSFFLDLPPAPRNGVYLIVREPYGYNALETNPVTLRRNGGAAKIDGSSADWVLDVNQAYVELIYKADESDWITQHPVTSVGAPGGITATLNLAGLAGKPVIVNPTEDGFVELTGVSGGTF